MPSFPDFPDIPGIPHLTKIEFNLEVKNENEGDVIELRKGSYIKILFELKPTKLLLNNDYFIFLNQTFYKLTINLERIKFLEKEIILKPNKEFTYSGYIGISCDTKIDTIEFSVPLQIAHLNESIEEIPINYGKKNIKIITYKREKYY